ncbi:MAG: phosphotransferase [Polyangiaceae bacterium]
MPQRRPALPPPPGARAERTLSTGHGGEVAVVVRESTRLVVKRPSPRLRDDPDGQALHAVEARALARLGGHGAPRLVESGHDAFGPYLLMSYVEGTRLDELEHAPERFEALAATTFEALASLHARGVVHGDVRPENLIVGAFPTFVDFAFARLEDEPTPPGPFRGTLAFAAPEVARDGPSGSTGASDVFALALALAAHAGIVLRPSLPPPALLVHAVEAEVERDHLERLACGLGAAVAHEPSERPSAAELARRLRR